MWVYDDNINEVKRLCVKLATKEQSGKVTHNNTVILVTFLGILIPVVSIIRIGLLDYSNVYSPILCISHISGAFEEDQVA